MLQIVILGGNMKNELLTVETAEKLARYEKTIIYLHELIAFFDGDLELVELFKDILSKLEVKNENK